MKIVEVAIDGFKSYAQRTVVSGFDPSFNAITGLNGSGKSNILDAICFVLGISNLSQVRASNLQDLVYKQGQAGVTKATVSIRFDNTDKSNSPVGYEACDEITVTRQVVIGGRNKYLINGRGCPQSRVQNLFLSVSLNVNNPHFLIMQGRITKVLNMKPPEILGMIEEAAGTRMFELNKESALKTIEKKQRKVEEIGKILAEEITPTLEKLRAEQAQFVRWSTNERELNRLQKLLIAFEYLQLEATVKDSSELKELQAEQAAAQGEEAEAQAALEAATAAETRLRKQREKEMQGQFKDMEDRVGTVSKELVKRSSELQHRQEAVASAEAAKKATTKAMSELNASEKSKTKEQAALAKACEAAEAEAARAKEKVADLERRRQATSAGMAAADDGTMTSLADQVAAAKQAAAEAGTEAKQAAIRMVHLKSELKEARPQLKKVEKEFAKMQSQQEELRAQVAALRRSLDALKFDETREAALAGQKAALEEQIAPLRETVEALSSKLSRTEFGFSDPEPGFDRSRVKGLVARLVEVRDLKNATALEVTAGGKLFNVVVDTEVTGSALIKKGKLRQRVTIIPLNKIQPASLGAGTVAAARRLVGAENVTPALDLIVYDGDLAAAMQFVFGKTLVVSGDDQLEYARQITFNPDVRTRTVTLDGDVFDPSGTLTGGSRTAEPVLTQLAELAQAKRELEEKENELAEIEAQLAQVRMAGAQYAKLRGELQLKEHSAQLAQERIAQSSQQQLVDRVASLEKQLSEEEARQERGIEGEKAAKARAEELAEEMKDFAGKRDEVLKKIEKELAVAKKEIAAATKAMKERQQERDQGQLEIAELGTEREALEKQQAENADAIAAAQEDEAKYAEAAAKKREEYEGLKGELDAQMSKIAACDKEITALTKKQESASSKLEEARIKLRKLEHTLSRFQSKVKDSAARLENMLSTHPWIEMEKYAFGKDGTEYDFKAHSPKQARSQLDKLQAEQNKLGKSINKKVMSMFEKTEQEYQDLMAKKRKIENDREKIEQVIAELEEKKNEALKKTWTKVNKDFGSIFSTLLPGTSAKLEPPEGGTVLDGLCVKVAFGDVWKESLTELSGGQRSLLALSLILALLLFKPAPVYILDEIDAALDLSHTQNIGQIIRTHFYQSQFIIVSLKEGMFNNANVLFRTKFIDGISTVARTVRSESGDGFTAEPTKPAGKGKKAAVAR